ncbi:MAG: flagellar hook assembly protein FlgD [Inquilinaceae bacterium]
MEISNTSATAQGSSTANARTQISETYDSFLTLLTTQLQYQDPTSPLDTNEFTNQLVQFTQVEQQIQGNEQLETLVALQGASQISLAASLVGKDVEVEGNALDYTGDGDLTFGYDLERQADSATINILDEGGTIVYSTTGNTLAGEHDFVWNGLDGNGDTVPNGTYRAQIVATDSEGEPVAAFPTVAVKVTGVELADGGVRLEVGKYTIGLNDVLSIRDGGAAI